MFYLFTRGFREQVVNFAQRHLEKRNGQSEQITLVRLRPKTVERKQEFLLSESGVVSVAPKSRTVCEPSVFSTIAGADWTKGQEQ